MPWFKVDDNLTFHAKTVAAGNPAMGLWVRAGAWAALQLTDGFIPDHMLPSMGTKAQAQRLADVRLWDRVEGGYRFHEWTERQPSRGDVEAERAAARDRMRSVRARKKGVRPQPLPQVNDSRSSEPQPNKERSSPEVRETFALPDPVPTQSQPDPSTLALAPLDARTAQTLIKEWIDHCAEPPASRVIGQTAKEVKQLLDEGITYERVRQGLADWAAKGQHPATIPSFVSAVGNRRNGGTKQQETDDLFARAAKRMGVAQ
jgi:hypothetical protein